MKYINTETLEVSSLTSVMNLENTSIPKGQSFGDWSPINSSPLPETDNLHSVHPSHPVEVDGKWYEGWEVVPREASEIEAIYVLHLEDYYDSVAKSKRYDSRFTFAVRAGYPGPYQEEAKVFATWMDTCNHLAYQIMQDVLSGVREIPTKEELLAELPDISWSSI